MSESMLSLMPELLRAFVTLVSSLKVMKSLSVPYLTVRSCASLKFPLLIINFHGKKSILMGSKQPHCIPVGVIARPAAYALVAGVHEPLLVEGVSQVLEELYCGQRGR